jgi:hypothetical protein
MGAEQTLQLTFLPWTAKGKKNQSEERLQSALRHQHTALAGHRRHREHKKNLRDKANSESAVTSSISPGQVSDVGTDTPWSLTRSTTPATSSHFSYDLERFRSPVTGIGTNLLGSFPTLGAGNLSKEFQSVLHDGMDNRCHSNRH